MSWPIFCSHLRHPTLSSCYYKPLESDRSFWSAHFPCKGLQFEIMQAWKFNGMPSALLQTTLLSAGKIFSDHSVICIRTCWGGRWTDFTHQRDVLFPIHLFANDCSPFFFFFFLTFQTLTPLFIIRFASDMWKNTNFYVLSHFMLKCLFILNVKGWNILADSSWNHMIIHTCIMYA